jgi:hypothetical protein
MAIAIETITQKIELTGVGDIVVTEIEQDPDVGDFVREIRFYDGPATSGTGSALEIFVLRLRSADRLTLQISSPAVDF